MSKHLITTHWLFIFILVFGPTCWGKPLIQGLKLPIINAPLKALVSPHQPIYLLPYYRIGDLDGPAYFHALHTKSLDASHHEIEMQPVSFKLLLATYKAVKGYITYTSRSNWQFYKVQDPFFRMYQHELGFFSELAISVVNPIPSLNFTRPNLSLRVGYLHQSNGLGNRESETVVDPLALERAWDRFYVSLMIKNNRSTLLIKAWHTFAFDILGPTYLNYNPDIETFLGRMKIVFTYIFSKDHYLEVSKRLFASTSYSGKDRTFSCMYFFPILPAFQLVLKGHSGYGSSVTTYCYPTFEFGIGFCFRFA